MNLFLSGIPMAQIPHPEGAWWEGITPVTNLQWRNIVETLMGQGAKYCFLEPGHRGNLIARQLSDLRDVLDTLGRDHVPRNWDGREVLEQSSARGALAVFQWFPWMSPDGFNRDQQPVVCVSWYHAKGWSLTQKGLYLLKDEQWEWSAKGGKRELEYATENGRLIDGDGRKLAHCSVNTEESKTIDVYDPRFADGPFGLRHKTGNVWEWRDEERGDIKRQFGVCGGSFGSDNPGHLRTTYRLGANPKYRDVNVGFRVGAHLRESNEK